MRTVIGSSGSLPPCTFSLHTLVVVTYVPSFLHWTMALLALAYPKAQIDPYTFFHHRYDGPKYSQTAKVCARVLAKFLHVVLLRADPSPMGVNVISIPRIERLDAGSQLQTPILRPGELDLGFNWVPRGRPCEWRVSMHIESQVRDLISRSKHAGPSVLLFFSPSQLFSFLFDKYLIDKLGSPSMMHDNIWSRLGIFDPRAHATPPAPPPPVKHCTSGYSLHSPIQRYGTPLPALTKSRWTSISFRLYKRVQTLMF